MESEGERERMREICEPAAGKAKNTPTAASIDSLLLIAVCTHIQNSAHTKKLPTYTSIKVF